MNKTQKELSTNGLKPKIVKRVVKLEGEALYLKLGRDKEKSDFNDAMNGDYTGFDSFLEKNLIA